MKYENKLIKKYKDKTIICNNIECKIICFEKLKFGPVVITVEVIEEPKTLDFIIVPLTNMYELERKEHTCCHRRDLILKKQ